MNERASDASVEVSIPQKPQKCCDIIMKGGVTSGIVYPLAVVELAKQYRFVSIGGTSAGAIAASVTAAAEYRRSRGDVRGFTDGIAKLPEQLGELDSDGKSALSSLFQPNPSTEAAFSIVMGLQGKKRWLTKSVQTLWGVVRLAPWLAIATACFSIALLVCGFLLSQAVSPWVGVPFLIICVFCIMGLLVATLMAGAKKVAAAIADNGFGLCSGYSPEHTNPGQKPLTEWLADKLDEVAGKTDPGAPLTFGDLWGDPNAEFVEQRHRKINLQMMTTNLTHGRPYQMPFEQRVFFYSPEEFRLMFPARIVDWMVNNSEPSADERYRVLPPAGKLPVIVAARMSLSFPLLISAVPLYAVDWSLRVNKEAKPEGRQPLLERCWFSDGGICSNFPVHMFDSPLPRWPTFAINLRPLSGDFVGNTDESKNVWMPRTPGDGILEQWYRFGRSGGTASVFGFLGAILETMQNWMDNTQLKVPGYRDRVAHVYLNDNEGGMNLNMDKEVLERVSERGRLSGEKLRLRFTGKDPTSKMDWDNHRWVRYRSTMTLLEKYLHDVTERYDGHAFPGERDYPELVERKPKEAPTSYPFTRGQRSLAEGVHRRLKDLIRKMNASTATFERKTPNPVPELRIRPKL
jgi:predicted acylesterase/phospholipase RssA